jgi:hypothetical protein
MRATAIAVNTSAPSVAKQFQRVLLLSALFVTASLNSWAQIVVSPASLTFSAHWSHANQTATISQSYSKLAPPASRTCFEGDQCRAQCRGERERSSDGSGRCAVGLQSRWPKAIRWRLDTAAAETGDSLFRSTSVTSTRADFSACA